MDIQVVLYLIEGSRRKGEMYVRPSEYMTNVLSDNDATPKIELVNN